MEVHECSSYEEKFLHTAGGKKWVWMHWRSWKEQFDFTCVISLLSQHGLVPRQTFSACDFSHGGMWDHVSICSASPAVWDAAKEAYFSFTATRAESLIWWLQEEGRKKLAEQQIELSENIKREQILLTTLKTPLRSLTMKHWRNLTCWSPLMKYRHFEHSTNHVYTIPHPVATSFCGQFPVCMPECGKWKPVRWLVSTCKDGPNVWVTERPQTSELPPPLRKQRRDVSTQPDMSQN